MFVGSKTASYTIIKIVSSATLFPWRGMSWLFAAQEFLVNFFFFFFFFLGFWSRSADKLHFIHSFMKLDFISQRSSKSTLPPAGLQHMQQCQVIFSRYYGNMIDPNEWDMLMVFSAVSGFEPTISWLWFFCLNHYTTAPRLNVFLLTFKFTGFLGNLPNNLIANFECWPHRCI